jgi:hypothetical protein
MNETNPEQRVNIHRKGLVRFFSLAIIATLYSINLGQLLAMVPDQPRTSLDILVAPTKYQSTY